MNHFITKKIGQTPTIVGSTLIYNVDFAGSDIPASGVSEIGIFKTRATLGKPIEHGCFQRRMSVTAQVVISQVIRHDQDHVG